MRELTSTLLAPLEKRIEAALLDGVVFVILWAAAAALRDKTVEHQTSLGDLALFICVCGLSIAYSTSGQTIGKFVSGIKVVSANGRPLNWGQGIIRTVALAIGAVPLFAGYLWVLLDPKQQALHDKLAGTLVVRSDVQLDDVPDIVRSLRGTPPRHRLGIVMAVLCFSMSLVCIATLFPVIAEIEIFDPWPGYDTAPGQLVIPRLTDLDFSLTVTGDARERPPWAGARFEAGAFSEFARPDGIVLQLWALRYDSLSASASDFERARERSPGESYPSATLFNDILWHNFSRCVHQGTYREVIWNRKWIVYVVLSGEISYFEDIAQRVRYRVASRWRSVAR